MIRNHIPDHTVVDHVITVDKDVSKSYDLSVVGN